MPPIRDGAGFVERFFIGTEQHKLTEADIAEYRRPYLNAGEDLAAVSYSLAAGFVIDGLAEEGTQVAVD